MEDNNLPMNSNIIYIIPNPQDKPVKIIIENNSPTVTTETYYLTLREVLKNILNQDWKLRNTLTTQQIRVEKGKVRKGYCDEVINFLNKRGISREYIEKEIATERERVILNINTNVSSDVLEDCKFGMIDLIDLVRPI
jgi:hypothetical protein